MGTISVLLRRWCAETLDLLLPTECAGCERPETTLCLHCQDLVAEQLAAPTEVSAQATALPILPFEFLDQAADGQDGDGEPPVLPVYAAGSYADELAAIMWAIKERSRPRLSRFFGPGFTAAISAALAQARIQDGTSRAILVPIPASATSLQQRGFWPLAEFLRHVDLPVPAYHLLEICPQHQRRGVAAQKTRGKTDRAALLRGKFELNTLLAAGQAHRPVVLVDDVLTTGATLAEGYRVLSAAGFRVRGAAVVMATPPGGHGQSSASLAINQLTGESP